MSGRNIALWCGACDDADRSSLVLTVQIVRRTPQLMMAGAAPDRQLLADRREEGDMMQDVAIVGFDPVKLLPFFAGLSLCLRGLETCASTK